MPTMQLAEAAGDVDSALPAEEVRWPFVVICCAPLLALRVWLLATRPQFGDFISYWASGRLFLSAGHPYSQGAVLANQRLQGWPQDATLLPMYCPPWSLPFVAAMASLPFRAAQSAWLAISLILDCFSALAFWNYFGGEKRQAWIAVLISATFIPMGAAEFLGQITPLMLASLAAFLLLLRSKRYFVAGSILLGLGFKPQLLYLFFLALVFWARQERLWSILAGSAVGYGMAAGVARLYNPHALDYFQRTFSAATEMSCGLGGALRSIFGMQHLWLQFLPCLLGVAWFLFYWAGNRRHWNWPAQVPLLILVSVSTSAHSWCHDFILALPALIAVAVHGGYRNFAALVAYLAIQAIVFSFGLPPAWMSVASILWLALYFIAKTETNEMDAISYAATS